MEAQNPTSSRHIAFMDWLRFFVVLSLTPFHAAISYTGAGTVFVYDETVRKAMEMGTLYWDTGPAAMRYFTMFMDNWFMHLLFLIAGIGAAFALRKRSPGEFLRERSYRLLWPLTVGTLTVVAAQVWLGALCFDHFEGGFFAFYPQFFNGPYTGATETGNFGYGHFWFLLYLFVFCAIALPLFMRVIRRGDQSALLKGAASLSRGAWILLPALWIALLEAIFRPGWPGFLNLVNDWANFTVYLSFFIFGFFIGRASGLLETIERNRHRALALGILAFAGRLAIYDLWTVSDGYSAANIAVQAFRGLAAYGFVLAAMGYGRRWLNRESRYLDWARDLSFPLYFLHYIFVTAITFLLIGTGFSPWVRWLLTVIATYLLIALFTLLARFVPFLRRFFGLRPPESLRKQAG